MLTEYIYRSWYYYYYIVLHHLNADTRIQPRHIRLSRTNATKTITIITKKCQHSFPTKFYRFDPTMLVRIHSKMLNGRNKMFSGNGNVNPMRSCHRNPDMARPNIRQNHNWEPSFGTSSMWPCRLRYIDTPFMVISLPRTALWNALMTRWSSHAIDTATERHVYRTRDGTHFFK